MRFTCTLVVCALAALPSLAQKVRFTDNSNSWKVLTAHDVPATYQTIYMQYGTDTTRLGVTYKVMQHAPGIPSGLYLIREDTLSGKVYAKFLPNAGATGADTNETVLYDYHWHAGDTVTRTGSDSFVHVITHVDSTMVNLIYHKVWHFQPVYSSIGTSSFDVIEGIGCTSNPMFPLIPMNFESGSKLLCFSNTHGTPEVSPKVGLYFDNTTSCTLGVDVITKAVSSATAAPNPYTENCTIILPAVVASGSITIVNMLGQVVYTAPVTNTASIDISNKIQARGCYRYQVTDGANVSVYYGKLIHE